MTRHVIPISGKDSLATALIQTEQEPALSYEYVFCDVGSELPETYAWIDHVEHRTGWHVERIKSDLESVIRGYDYLPSPKVRYCTRMTKIKPFEKRYEDDDEVYVYYGLRADEKRVGMRASDIITPVYPLVRHGIVLQDVWRLLAEHDLLPPSFFWPALHSRVRQMLGIQAGLIELLEPWEFRMLFSWRSRSNCFFCFYQRQYEYVGLSDTHPDLFRRACDLERTVGGEQYTWRQGYYLDEKILKDRNKIIDRRAKEVCGLIKKKFDSGLFVQVADTEIAATSCGLLCGK